MTDNAEQPINENLKPETEKKVNDEDVKKEITDDIKEALTKFQTDKGEEPKGETFHFWTPATFSHTIASFTRMVSSWVGIESVAFTEKDEENFKEALEPFKDDLDKFFEWIEKFLPYLKYGLLAVFLVGYGKRIATEVMTKKKSDAQKRMEQFAKQNQDIKNKEVNNEKIQPSTENGRQGNNTGP